MLNAELVCAVSQSCRIHRGERWKERERERERDGYRARRFVVDRNQQRADLKKHLATVAWEAASNTVVFHLFFCRAVFFQMKSNTVP